MNHSELLTKFPLEHDWKFFFHNTMNGIKEHLNSVVAKDLNLELPEIVLSQSCQIFFYIPMDLDNLLKEQYKPLVKLVKKYYSNQLPQVEENLLKLMNSSHHKGVPKEKLLEYIAFYIDDAHSKLFPNQPIILG